MGKIPIQKLLKIIPVILKIIQRVRRKRENEKISELIGTGDLFAEIAKIKTFSAFSGMDTKDLTAFLCVNRVKNVVLILFPP